MPHRRPSKDGSFGGPLDGVVKHFPHEVATRKADRPKAKIDSRTLKEKIDIHALLFQQAWGLEHDKDAD